ncbi:hypothetical protein HOE37_02965 [Candidatus Woesearchaeota archaeon]|jgi:hypothetical protein|nr:hypothetical protein [Candidatus Woesearchaeota archaeon]MBT4110789.1 hypothetical protein [Candidatus Woesearchaeota archaeon]MBT4336699.1 hypothetical protein [Candidatus Woesearchaeota archaeon]MBT4469552.1 hypothetical protein [Candidatus Woesearchaeota archaeon]MBT6743914.1 hypothetical protein [Candidatus Woesearchaeota archaeon]
MKFKKTICGLIAALSIGAAGCNDHRTEGVSYPVKGCSWHNYRFTFKGDKLLSVTAPCVSEDKMTCLYTEGNKKECPGQHTSHKVDQEVLDKYLRIYEEGQKH